MDAILPVEGGNLQALWQAFGMIIVSELGDKTFLIAAILAMRHPRLVVFAGAFSSLVVMSILSAEMGHLLPTLLPKKWTQFAAALLFLVFGGKMVLEAREMQGGSGAIQQEMREVEEELEMDETRHGDAAPLHAMEAGEEVVDAPAPAYRRAANSVKDGVRNLCGLLFGPVFIQAFLLTFLGEWGDRSQIATMVLAAAHNVYIIALGTIVGHSCCTAIAVIAGRWLATKISVKHVTYGGAALFLVFALIFFRDAFTFSEPMPHQELGEHDKDWIPR